MARRKQKRKPQGKKPVEKKEHRKKQKPFQSTQASLPILGFANGLVVEKNNEVSMIMEVNPSQFFLKKNEEQNNISSQFQNFLKIAPDNIHFKVLSVPANLSVQISKTLANIAEEPSSECRKMGTEYLKHLQAAQSTGTRRRFFISIPYEGNADSKKDDYLNNVTHQMYVLRDRLTMALKQCGNTVVDMDVINPSYQTANIFYDILNRKVNLVHSFKERCSEVYKRYADALGEDDIYIPDTEYISPMRINYSNSKCVECDGTYYSFLYLPGKNYPSMTYTGWLYTFINTFSGVDVDIYLSKQDRNQKSKELKIAIGHTEVDMYDNTNAATDAYSNSRDAYESGLYLRNGLMNGQDFYEVSTILTVTGSSVEEVDSKIDELQNIARQRDLALIPLHYQEEEAFNAVLPLPKLPKEFFRKMHRNCLTEGAATFYPFLNFEMIHDDGIYIADDLGSGTPVIPDFFNRDFYTNPHIFICGKTGAGKTVTILLMALRARVKQMPVYLIVPEKENEYRRVCEKIGGQFISLGNGSHTKINVFDISVPSRKAREKMKIIDGKDPVSDILLVAKVNELLSFFSIFIPTLSDISGMDQKQVLNDAILETYYRFGITEDNDSIWADQYHRHYKKYPIMSDLVQTLESYVARNDSSSDSADKLAKYISMLTKGSGEHFNGHTNVDLNNKFVVIGLENNTEEFFGLSIYLAMEFVWQKIKEDRSSEKMLIMDEWWKMAYNRIAAERTMQIARLARAEGCSMVIATQQMSDVYALENGKYGKAILNSCDTKIIMGLKKDELTSMSEMIDLTKEECTQIENFNKGEALLISGPVRMNIKFTPSQTEKMLTFTDSETINKFAGKAKEEAKIRARQEAIENAKSIDEIFVNGFNSDDSN